MRSSRARRQQQLANRDLLARSLENLNEEIKRKTQELFDIARERGQAVGTGPIMQELELKRLDRIESEILRLESEAAGSAKNETDRRKSLEDRITELHKRQAELEARIKANRREISRFGTAAEGAGGTSTDRQRNDGEGGRSGY